MNIREHSARAMEDVNAGRLDAAVDRLMTMRSALADDEDRFVYGATCSNVGLHLSYAGRFDVARTWLREGADRLDAVEPVDPDDPDVLHARASAHLNLGAVEREIGAYAAADASLRQARSLFERIGDARGVGRALTDLGLLQNDDGRPDDARATLHRALDRLPADAASPVDRRYRAHARVGLGLVAERLNDEDAADAHYDAAKRIYDAVGDAADAATMCYNRASLARKRGNEARAATLYREALGIDREAGNAHEVVRDRCGLADALDATGEAESAFAAFLLAFEAAKRIGFDEGRAAAQLGLARFDVRHGRLRRAVLRLTDAVLRADRAGSTVHTAVAYTQRGDAHLRRAHWRRAVADYRAAARVEDRVQRRLTASADAMGYFDAGKASVYDRLVWVHAGPLGRPREAFAWAERGKSRVLRRELSVSTRLTSRSLPDDLRSDEQRLRQRLVRDPSEATRRALDATYDAMQEHDAEYVALRRGDEASVDAVRQWLAETPPALAPAPYDTDAESESDG